MLNIKRNTLEICSHNSYLSPQQVWNLKLTCKALYKPDQHFSYSILCQATCSMHTIVTKEQSLAQKIAMYVFLESAKRSSKISSTCVCCNQYCISLALAVWHCLFVVHCVNCIKPQARPCLLASDNLPAKHSMGHYQK